MDYEHHSDYELARAAEMNEQCILNSVERRTAVMAEQERRRNTKPAIGTIYKHRYSWGDRGFWVVDDVIGTQVMLTYYDRGQRVRSGWMLGQIKNNLIEQCLVPKEEGK